MKHIFKQGSSDDSRVLLLLHGTGGTEQDLLPLAELIDPDAAILSVRGNVSENGMPRFFKRLREGVFDEEDLIERTDELNVFLEEAAAEYGFNRNRVVAVGYSNGANIAGSLLFHYKNSLEAALLFHPMVPRRGIQLPDQSGIPVFIGAGENDPICPAQETVDLKELLEQSGANVTDHWEQMGHRLTESEVKAGAAWYASNV
ncbi:alpha/beta hydrolase [Halobacillus locisalis]|uniref:Alpha/beta hydrolase n=1 Tax=Halobacillus locisalis TaxID=220753 RepID=A0A838CPZ6_9BACI|nr:alpha/beta hydrolase [Halobacillus locisalis]MBA2173948.1 alpha/beta hydrolase [Halobacillus locisalis]